MTTMTSHPKSGPNMEELGITMATLPNLRRVDLKNKIYRSSKQDLISSEDCKKLDQLGIKTILDFRSPAEYKRADGDKLLDADAQVLEVVVPSKTNRNRPLQTRTIASSQDFSTKRRYLFDFYLSNFEKAMVARATWYQKLIALFYVIIDWIVGSRDKKYSKRYFAKTVMNPGGLRGQYIDYLEYSSVQILTALRLLSEPANLPAMLNCALGKDRTGVVVALILSILGKSTDYIADEYALSEDCVQSSEIIKKTLKGFLARYHLDELFTHAPREAMYATLQYVIETYGSVENYLENIGFCKEDQEDLKRVLEAE